jgi:outer membrane immunogenic protein
MRTCSAAIGIAAICLVVSAGTACAADIPRGPYTAAPPYPTYNWVGPYVGPNLGYQSARATNAGDISGIMGGVQAGYNWQFGAFIVGAETDLQGSDADGRSGTSRFANPWFGTLRGRVGYALDNVMLYATFGFAYGGGRIETNGLRESNTHVGWAGGAGMEVGLTPNWSVKAEYLFVDLSDQRYVLFGNTGFGSNILRLGANYRF